MFLSFKSWLAEGCPEQTTFISDPFVQREDLTGTQLRNKLRELDKLLKSHDFWYTYSDDSRTYKKGKESQERIEKLVKEIGPDGKKAYRNYIKKFESKETGTERYMDSQNWFPETKNVKTTGSLNEMKPLGAEGVSYMSDGGNLSFGLDQWTPPSEPKKTLLQKHHERTNKFGKVTNDK